MAIEKVVNIIVNEVGISTATSNTQKLSEALSNVSKSTSTSTKASLDNAKALAGNSAVVNALSKITGEYQENISGVAAFIPSHTKLMTGLSVVQSLYTAVIGASTGALKAFKVALITTGVGALVVGLGFLISAMNDAKKETEENEHAQTLLGEAIKNTTEIMKAQREEIDYGTKLLILNAEAAGKSEQQLREIQRQAHEDRIQAIREERDKLLALQSLKNISVEKAKEINDALLANTKAFIAEVSNEEIAQKQLTRDLAVEKRKEEEEEAKRRLREAEKRRKELLAKEKQLQKELAADIKSFNDKINAGNLDRYNTETENRKEKDDLIRSLRYQSDIDELNDERAKAEKLLEAANASQEEFMLLGESFRQRQEELENKHEVSKIEKYNEGIENEKLSYEARYNLLDNQNKLILESDTLTEQQRTEMLAENQEARNAIRDAEYEHNKKIASASSNLLGQAADLAGKHTAVGKGLAVAQALISTYVSAVDSYKGMVAAIPGPVGIAGGVVAAAFSIASGLATVKKIMSVKTPGASGSAGSDAGGASPSVAPSFNVVGTSSNNQLAQSIGRQQNQPVEAFVVGSSVTSQQALDRNRIQVATFN